VSKFATFHVNFLLLEQATYSSSWQRRFVRLRDVNLGYRVLSRDNSGSLQYVHIVIFSRRDDEGGGGGGNVFGCVL